MTPNADINATRATAPINAVKSIASTDFASRLRTKVGDVWVRLLRLAALCMIATLLAPDGGFAADAPAIQSAETTVAAAPAYASPDLSGRWTGWRRGFGVTVNGKGCGQLGCTITYDISACGADWCGVRVDDDGACMTAHMKLSARKGDGGEGIAQPVNRFQGRLELAANADAFVIEARYSAPPKAAADAASAGLAAGSVSVKMPDRRSQPRLSMIGDTGPELMMFRRSFPFHAELAREGPARCSAQKPVS